MDAHWISTHDGSGRRNLAPYSFFNLFNYRPPIIGFASVGYEDTLRDAAGSTVLTWLILGEVVGVHIARRLLCQGLYDTAGAAPVLRGGGRTDYFQIQREAPFRMRQPA